MEPFSLKVSTKLFIVHRSIHRGQKPRDILPAASHVNNAANGGVFPANFDCHKLQNVIRQIVAPLFLAKDRCSSRYPDELWIHETAAGGFPFLW